MAKKEKKPFFKRKWVWALIILIVLFIAIPTGEKDEPQQSIPQEENTKTTTPETKAPDTKPTEKQEPQPETGPKDDESDSMEDVSVEALSSLIELVLAENFKDYEISSDGNTISVNLWQDGIALEAATIQANGGGADNESWMNMKSGIGSMSDSICELIKTAGRDDVVFSLNVLNDQNKENTLLAMVNSSIIYDALA